MRWRINYRLKLYNKYILGIKKNNTNLSLVHRVAYSKLESIQWTTKSALFAVIVLLYIIILIKNVIKYSVQALRVIIIEVS